MSKRLRSLGLMSGTSLDGIDVALIETDGLDFVAPGPSRTFAYGSSQRELLRQALRDAVMVRDRRERPGVLANAERELTEWHIAAVKDFLSEQAIDQMDVDVIGFHGQTVVHRPERMLTIQLGDGALMARELGIKVVHDMRAADVACGGQGAPLVPIYHQALATTLRERPVAFVNIGGVANITYVGADGELIAFDTGPGNALIDDFFLVRTGRAFDENGSVAAAGRVDESVVAQYLGDPFFERAVPKSLDRNAFSGMSLGDLSTADGSATLTALTIRSITKAVELLPSPPERWVICGGGRKNNSIMSGLAKLLPLVISADDVGLNGDAIEAEAWAYLAVRSVLGLPLSFPMTTGVTIPTSGGTIAVPTPIQ